jgi:alpha-L-rhamnosidase
MQLKTCFIALAAILVSASCSRPLSPIVVRNLKCGNRVNPLAVDIDRVAFNWELESRDRGQFQKAYRVLVASSPIQLVEDRADVWDSGKQKDRGDIFIVCDSRKLEPGTQYFWKVRVWDKNDRPSDWSAIASFMTALASGKDGWGGAKWIAFEELPEALKFVPGVHGRGDGLGDVAVRRAVIPLFRKEFEAGKDVLRAFLYVCGLGQYELWLNGLRVGDGFLVPGWTDYLQSCLYNTYDVTPLLRNGRNAVGLIVGNGFFNINRERYRKLVIAYGLPMMILKLRIEYASGRSEDVVSGPDWKTAPSPITFASIYGGEDYDARLERPGWNDIGHDDSGWENAVCVTGPGGKLRPETDYPLRVMQEVKTRTVAEPKPGVFVYDFGQNASGVIRLRVRGEGGRQVRVSPAELLGGDGLIDQRASGAPYELRYTLKGVGEEEWTPRFTYYGFRYAQVEGAVPEGKPSSAGRPEILGLDLLHTRNSSPQAGSFECSSGHFNRIYELINWAIKSNLASVPTDCPHREKLGWLEQTHLMGGSIHYNFDILNLYNKLIDDMIEAQLPGGLVPDIAPEFVPFEGGFRDSPEWGSASVILPWLVFRWYGDQKAVTRAYPMMKRYAAYLGSRAAGHLLSHGLGDWFDLGPDPPGPSQLTPLGLTATAIYYQDLDLLSKMAAVLGSADDSRTYRELAANVSEAFNRKYFYRDAKSYATGSQTSNAMPLALGLVREEDRLEVFRNLVSSIRTGGLALTAGDIGFHYLLQALAEGGASELIAEMNSRSDVPGYGYQLAKGATALTESWAAREDVSNNHMMLGHLMEWFYSGLAGIRQAKDSVGYKRVVISPQPVGDIDWVEARYRSISGEIRCSWKIMGDRFILETGIPVGSRALVYLPASEGSSILEGGQSLTRSRTVRLIRRKDDAAVLEIRSGFYRFESEFRHR